MTTVPWIGKKTTKFFLSIQGINNEMSHQCSEALVYQFWKKPQENNMLVDSSQNLPKQCFV